MTTIENLKSIDPFADAEEGEATGGISDTKAQEYIHIRIQQRNGRKTLTTIQGLPRRFDQKKILKVIRKKFACNGTIVEDDDLGQVIQLQGDQRKHIHDFLIDKTEGLEMDAKVGAFPLPCSPQLLTPPSSSRSTVSKRDRPDRSIATGRPSPPLLCRPMRAYPSRRPASLRALLPRRRRRRRVCLTRGGDEIPFFLFVALRFLGPALARLVVRLCFVRRT
jgi:translation initiation factor 1